MVYLDEPAEGSEETLIALFFGLAPSVASVGVATSLTGEIVTTLRGGVALLGLGLRGDGDLLLDLFPSFGLVS